MPASTTCILTQLYFNVAIVAVFEYKHSKKVLFKAVLSAALEKSPFSLEQGKKSFIPFRLIERNEPVRYSQRHFSKENVTQTKQGSEHLV